MFDNLSVLYPKDLDDCDAALARRWGQVDVQENEVSFCGRSDNLPFWRRKPRDEVSEKGDCRLPGSARLASLLNGIWVQPVGPNDEPRAANSAAAQGSSNSVAGQIVGNRRSKIYAWPGCGSYDKMAPQNRVLLFVAALIVEFVEPRASSRCSLPGVADGARNQHFVGSCCRQDASANIHRDSPEILAHQFAFAGIQSAAKLEAQRANPLSDREGVLEPQSRWAPANAGPVLGRRHYVERIIS